MFLLNIPKLSCFDLRSDLQPLLQDITEIGVKNIHPLGSHLPENWCEKPCILCEAQNAGVFRSRTRLSGLYAVL